jgi:phosphonate transport system substrate-binding protein
VYRIVKRASIALATLWLFAAALAGCSREPPASGPQLANKPGDSVVAAYRLAVHPLYNPTKLFEAYQPLVDYLNRQIPDLHLVLEASRDYGEFEAKYRAGTPAFILPNPWQTLQAMKSGYHVIASAGEPEDFKGIFVARRDSLLKNPADLKGKAVSYPSRTALAACIMPQYFLYRHGVNIRSDIENRYVGSQESSIMNAYLGKTAAGATWPPPWRAFLKDHPREAADMRVIWQTESLINNSVMVRADVPPALASKVRALLTDLRSGKEGREILAGMETARFIPASDSDYDAVREYVARFEREVRPVEQK